MRTPQIIKNLFRYLGNIITPSDPGGDIGVARGRRVYFDADQAVPNTYMTTPSNGILNIYVAGNLQYRHGSSVDVAYNRIEPNTDGTLPFGETTNRWRDGYFSQNVGIYIAAWEGSFHYASAAVKYLQNMRLTTAEKLAMSGAWGAPEAGRQVYDTTLNQMSYWNGGAWVNY